MPVSLPEHVRTLTAPAEEAVREGTLADVLPLLRTLSLDDFAPVLWSMPNP